MIEKEKALISYLEEFGKISKKEKYKEINDSLIDLIKTLNDIKHSGEVDFSDKILSSIDNNAEDTNLTVILFYIKVIQEQISDLLLDVLMDK